MREFPLPGSAKRPLGYSAGIETITPTKIKWQVKALGFSTKGTANSHEEAIQKINDAIDNDCAPRSPAIQ